MVLHFGDAFDGGGARIGAVAQAILQVEYFIGETCGIPLIKCRGARIRYSAADIFELALAFEFAEFGVDPRLIIQVIRRHWRSKTGLWAAVDYAQRFPGDDIHVVVETHFMSWKWNKEKFKPTDGSISITVVADRGPVSSAC
jgi:hypothetical protein